MYIYIYIYIYRGESSLCRPVSFLFYEGEGNTATPPDAFHVWFLRELGARLLAFR